MPSAHGFSVCIYCAAVSRVSSDGSRLEAQPEKTVTPEQLEEIRSLLLAGEKARAVARYTELTGADPSEAEEVVGSMRSSLEARVLLSRPLNLGGAFFTLCVLVLLSATAWLALTDVWPRFALYIAGVAFLLLWPFWLGLFTTVRYLGAKSAPARVIRSVDAGLMKGGKAHIYKLLIDVAPSGETPFKAEVVVPVRKTNLDFVKPGAEVRARYFASDPTRVLCQRA
jgi:hypothetical protein